MPDIINNISLLIARHNVLYPDNVLPLLSNKERVGLCAGAADLSLFTATRANICDDARIFIIQGFFAVWKKFCPMFGSLLKDHANIKQDKFLLHLAEELQQYYLAKSLDLEKVVGVISLIKKVLIIVQEQSVTSEPFLDHISQTKKYLDKFNNFMSIYRSTSILEEIAILDVEKIAMLSPDTLDEYIKYVKQLRIMQQFTKSDYNYVSLAGVPILLHVNSCSFKVESLRLLLTKILEKSSDINVTFPGHVVYIKKKKDGSINIINHGILNASFTGDTVFSSDGLLSRAIINAILSCFVYRSFCKYAPNIDYVVHNVTIVAIDSLKEEIDRPNVHDDMVMFNRYCCENNVCNFNHIFKLLKNERISPLKAIEALILHNDLPKKFQEMFAKYETIDILIKKAERFLLSIVKKANVDATAKIAIEDALKKIASYEKCCFPKFNLIMTLADNIVLDPKDRNKFTEYLSEFDAINEVAMLHRERGRSRIYKEIILVDRVKESDTISEHCFSDNPNGASNLGETALHAAVILHQKDLACKLVEAGADLNKPNPYGLTPLDLIVISRQIDLLKKLWYKQPDVKGTIIKLAKLKSVRLHGYEDIIKNDLKCQDLAIELAPHIVTQSGSYFTIENAMESSVSAIGALEYYTRKNSLKELRVLMKANMFDPEERKQAVGIAIEHAHMKAFDILIDQDKSGLFVEAFLSHCTNDSDLGFISHAIKEYQMPEGTIKEALAKAKQSANAANIIEVLTNELASIHIDAAPAAQESYSAQSMPVI